MFSGKSFFLFMFLFFSLIGLCQKKVHEKENAKEYIEHASNLLDIPAKKIYYLSDKSKNKSFPNKSKGFGMVVFIKDSLSVNWNKISRLYAENSTVPISCNSEQLNKTMILNALKPSSIFKGFAIKQMATQHQWEKPKTTMAILFYSKKFDEIFNYYKSTYLNPLKSLQKRENIPFIVITLDGQETIKGVDVLNQNSIIYEKQ